MRATVWRIAAPPVALLASLLAGCDRTGPVNVNMAAADPSGADREAIYASRPPFLARERLSSYGRFLVRYRPIPDPIPLNQTFDLEITVRRAGDPAPAGSLSDLVVGVNAEMSSHSHGMNVKPIVTPVGPGTFKIEGMMLHMLGHWTLNVDLTHAGITERAVFDVLLQ